MIKTVKTGTDKSLLTSKKAQDKVLGNITKQIGGLQSKVRISSGTIKTDDVSEGEFIFTSVNKDSESLGYPAEDEGRMYFKGNGVLYQLTGTKVGG